jgi:hypothetical protein
VWYIEGFKVLGCLGDYELVERKAIRTNPAEHRIARGTTP